MKANKRGRGQGRVYIHGNFWWADITFLGTRRRSRVAPACSDKEMNKKMKKQAEAVLAKWITEISENKFLNVKRDCHTTFGVLADKYLEWAKEKHCSYKISDVYFVEALRKYFGDRRMAEISRQDIERYKNRRLNDGAGNSSINHELATLRRMFNLAIKFWEHPDNKQEFLFDGRNPAEGFEKLAEESRERKLSKGELIKLVEHIRARLGLVSNPEVVPVTNGRDRKGYRRLLDFILVAVMTGMRKGEIKGLKFGSSEIHLSDTDPMDNFVHLPGKRTKSGKPRIVFLNRTAKSILSRPFDFSYEPRHLWETVRTDAGLGDVTIHDLRRSFASYLEAIGSIGHFTIQALLGHKVAGQLKTTSIYVRADLEKMREAMDRLEMYLELMSPIGGHRSAQFNGNGVADSCVTRYN